MLYAKVVLALPVEGPFDYRIDGPAAAVASGMRCWVNFRNKRSVGFIVGTAAQTSIANVKPVLSLIDTVPVFNPALFELCKDISAYYGSSLGEALAAALPAALRRGAGVRFDAPPAAPSPAEPEEDVVVHDLDGAARWDFYLERIARVHAKGRSTIVLVPDIAMVGPACALIKERLGLEAAGSFRTQPQELAQWTALRQGGVRVVVGTRSSVFAPVPDLGLIIVDEEEHSAYKQDQVPHYHARTVSAMRCRRQGAQLVLGSRAPSLESFRLTALKKARLVSLARSTPRPQVRLIDMKDIPLVDRKRKMVLARFTSESIRAGLARREKVLVALNRKGFATVVSCSSCGRQLVCPRCNVNLVYYYSDKRLRCRYCSYSQDLPTVCPECKSGYVKLGGMGTEKAESELARLFPEARIMRLDGADAPDPARADIFVATQAVIATTRVQFGLTCVLGIDASLNIVDFRAGERAFALLSGLAQVTAQTMIVQTNLSSHYVLEAMQQQDPGRFYRHESSLRRQLGFPPYRHFVQLRLRGKSQEKVEQAAQALHAALTSGPPCRGWAIVSMNPAQPPKLRNNFYWVILASGRDPVVFCRWVRTRLQKFRVSGIIVTVDVDPA